MIMKKIVTILIIATLAIGVKYKGYSEYKEDLISKYGKDTYNLMNQEAGINSEAESFVHYVRYGI